MKVWLDTYPHKVYASILLLEGKVIDYKIGERYWKSPADVSLRGQIKLGDLKKCETKYKYWEVNSDSEHDKVFEVLAKEWIKNN